MGGDMMLEIAENMEELNDILKDPYIWNQAAEDDLDPSTFYPECNERSFWLIARDKEIYGLIMVTIDSSVTISIHPYMLERHKGKGYYMMKSFLDWYLENTKENANKINTKIPSYNDAGYKLALKMGFMKEGTDRQSYKYKGEIFDQHLMGITKDEIKEVMKWAA